MFHHRRNKDVTTIREGIRFGFDRVFQVTIDKELPIRGDGNRGCDIQFQLLFIVYDLHAPTTEHIGWTDDEGVTDPLRHH